LVGVAGLEVLGRRREGEQVLMRGELQKKTERRRIREQEREQERKAADPIGSSCSGWR
jgi:hypothetical protein